MNENLELIYNILESLYNIDIESGKLYDRLEDIIDDFYNFSIEYKKYIHTKEMEKLKEWVKNT